MSASQADVPEEADKDRGASKMKKGVSEKTPSCLSRQQARAAGGDVSILLATQQGLGKLTEGQRLAAHMST